MLETISTIIGILGWFVTGAWILREWYVKRQDKPRINLNASLREIITQGDHRIIEVLVEIENSGDVRHVFSDMIYTIRGSDLEYLETDPTLLDQVSLPTVVVSRQRFFPSDWRFSFVDAGQVSRYRALVLAPVELKLLKLSVIMIYNERASDFHMTTWHGAFETVTSSKSWVDVT